ncbi:MAG: rhodanese-like domain-containing protein [Aquabacterium sp.]
MTRHTLSALAAAAAFTFVSPATQAQQAAPAADAAASTPQPYVAPPWTYKTRQLTRNDVDKLLGNPKKLLAIDVRRPDELVKYGSLPVYLNIQLKDLPEALDYIPRDRVIVTISNRAHRAGAAGDLLASMGFKVAGALGSEDYREAGGSIQKVLPPPPKTVN